MDMNDIPAPQKPNSWFAKGLIGLAGADKEILGRCPVSDTETVKAVALILLFQGLYQATIFSLISHKIFGHPGHIRPELVIASTFIAAYIVQLDSHVIIRAGWLSKGIQDLKRGGLDISGGLTPLLKAAVLYVVRIFLLALVTAQLTAIFFALLLFGHDTDSELLTRNLQSNKGVIARATSLTDDEIRRAGASVDTEATRYGELAAQVSSVRQNQVDPGSSSEDVQQARKELNDLLATKADTDHAVAKAQAFSTDEWGGIKGSDGNSGVAGYGVRHRAALERVTEEKARAATLANEVAAARARLDAIQRQHGMANSSTRQESREQLPVFEKALADESAKLEAARGQLAMLTAQRDQTIQKAVESAPDYVPIQTGLLAQLAALEHVVEADPKIKAVVILIDLAAFGFELAGIIATNFAYVPTTYAALVAANHYAAIVRIVDDLARKLNRSDAVDPPVSNILPPESQGATDEQHEQGPDQRPGSPAVTPDPFDAAAEAEPRRPRGRPRKTPADSLN